MSGATESVERLECGTSLVELEHHQEEDGSHYKNRRVNGNASSFMSLDTLRESLAMDVVKSNDDSPLEMFTSPFSGRKVPLVYCDQTASNRPIRSIEEYLQKVCLPLYGNTHTNTSLTGSQSTAFVAEARQIVAEATNAKITGKASQDVILFAGNGTTGAVDLLIDCLGLKYASAEKDKRPVVFVGPFEHHSNLIPWRESGCEIVMVPQCADMTPAVDLVVLESLLTKPEYHGRLKMGTFSAASNVSGAVANVDAIAKVLRKRGALAFFDYATGAPYLTMNMNGKDAIFLSPHKMLGGIGTPGVLIVKKHLVNQVNAPAKSGGGTVFYVTSQHHRFLSNRIDRYEGGTPNILGIMRTGMTFLLKRRVEEKMKYNAILDYDFQTHARVVERLKKTAPHLVMLGSASGEEKHLPIFSFLIRCGRRFLHYNFVCAILNDVFGIQSRGGCQCSGPYSQRLLGLTNIHDNDSPNERNRQVEHALVHYKEKAELLRPGYTRLSLPFKGLRTQEVEFVLSALEWVAKNGWALMCQYRCNHRTGEWRHYTRQGKPLGRTERKWLSHFDKFSSSIVTTAPEQEQDSVESVLERALANADLILEEARKDQRNIMQAIKMNEVGQSLSLDDALLDELRWYVYPKECGEWLSKGHIIPPETSSTNVLGAINPISAFGAEGGKTTHLSHSVFEEVPGACEDENGSRKRKTSTQNTVDGVDAASNTTGTDGAASSVVAFRDGEHCGEATVAEIESGFEDGELSEQCEIFDKQLDAWVLVDDFFGRRKKARTDSRYDQTPAVQTKKTATATATAKPNNTNEKQMQELETTKDAKSQAKKPPRDSSTWGQNACIAPAANAATLPNPHQSMVPKKKRGRGIKPPPKMMRQITQAMIQWNMVEEGDRLLLGLSGGKDSLSLLHCLLEFQRKLPIKFEIEVCTIDPMTPSFDPSPLIPYVESLGLNYHYIRDDIVTRANSSGKDGKVVSSLCAFCARMKRGNLYTCARKNGCNKLVLAQHLDDCAESFLMSVMHNGFLRTMKANYHVNAGDISVIRPMVYCRESLMTDFAKTSNLPVINENCPACFEEPKERARIKKLLSREETLYPNFYDNIRRSLIPLLHEDATAVLRCYTEEAVAKSRKENHRKVNPKDGKGKKGKGANKEQIVTTNDVLEQPDDNEQKRVKTELAEATEEELVKELARRKAERYRLSGAMARLGDDDGGGANPSGQVCSLNGKEGGIPCHELME